MTMKKGSGPAARCALLIALAGCGDAAADNDAFTVTDSAGLVIARNAAGAADSVAFTQPVRRIGMEDGAAEYLFEYVTDVEALDDGRVVVVDNRGARVALFDSAGSWLVDVGGRGEGPGEYVAPLRLWRDGDRLKLWDPVARRLTDYDLAGAFQDSEMLPWKSPSSPLVRLGAHWVDEREWGQQMQPGPAGGAIVRLGEDGAVIDTLVGPYPVPRIGWEITDSVTGRGMMVNPPTFSAQPRWTVGADRLFWTPADEPRVDVYDANGVRTRSIHLAREQAPVTPEVREEHARGYQTRFGLSEESVARMRDGGDYATSLPTVSGLLADDVGNLWVAEFEPGLLGSEAGRRWDVIDDDGRVLRHIVFPAGFQLLHVRDGRAYGVSVLESGVHVVDVFEVSEM